MKSILTLFTSVFIVASFSFAQYCTPVYSSLCSSGDFIQNFSTANGASNITNNASACNGQANNYIFYSALSCSQIQGQTIDLNMQAGASWGQGFRVWIDWNNNNSFADAGEDVYVSPSSGTGLFTGTITVPFSATPGTVRMRVMCRYGTVPLLTDYCATNLSYGEVEDYNFTVIASVGCSGQPNAGTAVASSPNVCPATTVSLSLSGNTLASGITYQWQSSADGVTYADIISATSSNYSTTQSANTYYQCITTCTSSSLSDTSTSVFVTTDSFLNCYCTSSANFTGDEEILNVSVGIMSNTSTCSTTGGPGSTQSLYSDYTTLVAAPTLAASANYNFSVGIGTCGGNYNSMIKIFIDYNQNGSFADPGEEVYVLPASINGPYTATGSFTIPVSATVGTTRMRVVNVETSSAASITPCGTYGYGETEDYYVNIAPVPTCPQPTALSLVSADLTSAELTWIAGGSETQWVIEYGPVGFALGTGTVFNTTTIPDTLTGLTSNSFYTAYIYGVCAAGVDSSYYAGPISWNTYNQDQYLEADTECPTSNFIDISNSGLLYTLTSDAEATITLPFPLLYQGVLYNDGTLGNNGAFILGTTTAQVAGFNGQLNVAATGLYPYWDNFQTSGIGVWSETIGVAPNRQFIIQWQKDNNIFNSNDPMNFELIIDEATMEIYFVYDDVNNNNASYNNGLSATIGAAGVNQDIQLSFNNTSYLTDNSCAHFYYTDCPKPVAFTISYITPDEVAFTWSAGLSGETDWTIIYGPAGFDPLTSGTTITSTLTSVTLPGLTQNTQYDVYVYADCSASLQSNGLMGTFLTAPYCSNPSGMVNSTAVDSIFTSWSWTESSPAYPSTGFNLQYGMNGFQLYSGLTVPVNNDFTDTIADATLLAGGVYQVYVQAVCGTDTSQFVGPFNVTMPLTNDSVCGAEMLMANGTVYTFNNAGATVQPSETIIAPPATGAQTTTGWINSTLNNTVWFKFVAPTTGNIRVKNTAINYAGQSAVYSSIGCSDFNNFTLIAANDNEIGGSSVAANYTVCGLTPGNTYYLLHDGNSATTGNYSISILPINLNAGSFVDVLDVCTGSTVNLFDGINSNDNGGVWTAELASIGTGLTDSIFNSQGFAYQTFNFEYRMTEGCAYDSIISQVKIWAPSSAGNDGTITVCRNEPFDLLSGLTGNVDFGGTWYNPSNVAMPSSSITSGNLPGQYNYDYITGNGVCPDDTSNALVNVLSCDWLDVQEMYFGEMSLIPNPTNGFVYITNTSSTEVFNYEIADLDGRVIATKKSAINGSSVTEINLSGKVTGMYLIRVFNDNAEKVFRVILQ